MFRMGCIHQPPFLPWLGIAESMLVCDVFVAYDDVQFEKGGYQNRTRVLLDPPSSRAGWLTVPVLTKGRLTQVLRNVEIDRNEYRARGLRHILHTLEQNYAKAPFFGDHFPALEAILRGHTESLLDLNMELLDHMKSCLRANCRIVLSSNLGVPRCGRTLRLAEICRLAGVNAYYSGSGTKGYLQQEEFSNRGITIVWHDYETRHEVYPQTTNGGDFVPGLSWVDMLFHCGPDEMRRRLLASGNAKLAEYGMLTKSESEEGNSRDATYTG